MAYKDDEESPSSEWYDDEHETLADLKYALNQREEETPVSRVERDAAEAGGEEDWFGYDTLKTPTRKSHGRMKRIARGEEEDYARTSAGYLAELEELDRKYDD